jgi:anti-anti-sigma regulatory factor
MKRLLRKEAMRVAGNICTGESDNAPILKLEGRWTVERANELKQALIEASRNGDHLVIDVADLEEADLCFLQLFCSAHRTFSRLGKHVALQEKKSESFKRLVRDAGFKRELGCQNAQRASCLWIGEWEP